MRPENTSVDIVRAVLQRGRRRLRVRALLHAVTLVACVVAAGCLFTPFSARSAISLVALAAGAGIALYWIRRRSETTSRVAVLIERGDPSLKNLVVTAEELLRHPDRSAEWISRR